MKFMKYIFMSMLFPALVGCASLTGIKEEPKAEIKEVYAKDSSFLATTLVFVVNVQNPNAQEIKIDGIDYKVFVSGEQLSSAKVEDKIVVPAHKDVDVEIPLPLEYASLLNHLGKAVLAGELMYRIEGSAKMSLLRIPFAKEGKLQLK